MSNGSDIATEVADAIREASAAVGDGSYSATIRRLQPVDESVYPTPEPGEDSYSCSVLDLGQVSQLRDNTPITTRNIQLMVAADAETEPQERDLLDLSGYSLRVVRVDRFAPGGELIYWTCTCTTEKTVAP